MTDLVGYSSINSRSSEISIATIPSKSPFSDSSSLNNSLMNTATSSIAHSTATITQSVNDTMRSMSSIVEAEVIHPTISEPMTSTGIQVYVCSFNFCFVHTEISWIWAISGVTVSVISFTIVSFICFIVCFKR